MSNCCFDAFFLVSFGGPEGRDDVLPFLNNVLRGRNVPEQRKLAVAEHYYQFDGVSPINQQNRDLLRAIQHEFDQENVELPVYWGNRNWHPMLADTLRQMRDDGIKHALALLTSPFQSFSGCRQYLDAIAEAQREVGAGAPQVSKLRAFFNHPLFVEAWSARAREGLAEFTRSDVSDLSGQFVLFTAHSIPISMAKSSPYVEQLLDLAELVAADLGIARSQWELVYQSRSGPPHQPWLEPDVCDVIEDLGRRGIDQVLLVPIGFLSDHIEVLFDLDVEAVEAAQKAGVQLRRAPTVGTHAKFVTMVLRLIGERMGPDQERPTVGKLAAAPDQCPADCCRLS
jgi:ferrochelatase